MLWIMLAIAGLLATSVGQERVVTQLETEIREKKIKALSTDPNAHEAEDRLLLLTLLLHQHRYEDVAKYYKTWREPKDFYITMAYVQAVAATKRYDDCIWAMGNIKPGQEDNLIEARRRYYAGLKFLSLERDMAYGFFHQGVRLDPMFVAPYAELAKIAFNRADAVKWNIRVLSLVQPDTDEAKSAMRRLLQYLK